MNLTVKTLKGAKFVVEAKLSNTVGEVKSIIEASKSEFPAANLKLIHSGKVLKDDATVESCNIKSNDFLVCMVSKTKKKAPTAPTPISTSTATSASTTDTSAHISSALETTSATPTNTSTVTSAATTEPSPSTTVNTTTTAATPAPLSSSDDFSAEVISNLTSMGFPEAEARACLRASQGNPDRAVEFLMNGIPPTAAANTTSLPSQPSSATTGGTEPLAALRNHPQFDALRSLVQTNPRALQAVLSQIGEQQPSLLEEINANQPLFLQMMNEPVSGTPSSTAPIAPFTSTSGSGAGAGSRLGSMLGGGANPAQMAQMLSGMNPTELSEMASMMGLTPEQLTATAQMIGQMPPEQFQDFVSQALQQENGMGGMGTGGTGGMPGQHVLSLSEEEMAAVDRLTEMGFDRSEAAQAFLACDKNEALAANLLMDSAGDFGMGDGGTGAGGNGGNANDADDMYD